MRLLSVLDARRVARAVVLPAAALAVAATTALPLAAVAADDQQVQPLSPGLRHTTPDSGSQLQQTVPDDGTDAPGVPEAPSDGTPGAGAPSDAVPTGGPACGGGALGEGAGAGAVDPRDGQRYVASLVAQDVLRLSVVLPSGEASAPVADVRLPGVDTTTVADGGGIAFDAAGRLYVVTAGDGLAVLHRTDAPLAATGEPATALVTTVVGRTVERIAFDSDGLLHLADASGSTVVDPTSGDVLGELGAADGQALACGRPSQVDVTLALPQGRVAAGDRFRVAITGAGYGADGPASAWRVEGLAVPGATYDLLVTAADGTAPTTYDATWDCGPAGRTDGTVARVTVPRAAFGSETSCTVTLVPAGDATDGAPRAEALVYGPQLPSLGTQRNDGSAGVGLPGVDLPDMGGVLDSADDADRPGRDRTPGDGGAGIDLGDDGGLGLTDANRNLGEQADQDYQSGDGGPLAPVLPNTGGPSALAIPLGLGAVVAGSVLIARRRRTA